jgi:hypothetical protein
MGYFEGLASGIIKKDKSDNPVYYPWGLLGKGYVLPNMERETAIKKMVILFYQLFFGLFFVHLFLLKSVPIFALLVVALVIWFLVKSHQLTKDCPKSDEKLTLKEGYTNSAKAHNKWMLWILLVVSVFFTLAGIAFLMSGKISFGLMMTIVFGACTTAIGYMIKVKNQQSA